MFLLQGALLVDQCQMWKEETPCDDPSLSQFCFKLFDFGPKAKLTTCENIIPEQLSFLDSLQCQKLGESRDYCIEEIKTPWIMVICIIIVALVLIFGIWCCACCCCAQCCACCCCNKHHKAQSDVETTTLAQQPAIFQSPIDQ